MTAPRRPLFRLLACFAAGALLGWAGLAQAQSPAPATEASIKAAFLFKFGSFVEWPAGTFQRPDQPIVIAVSGDEEVAAELDQITAGRRLDARPVVVRRVAEGASLAGVHILYLGSRRESRLRDAIESAIGPALIVTSQPGALQSGSVINFSNDAGRVRFSASLAAAEARNLKLSARLLAVAQNVEGRTK